MNTVIVPLDGAASERALPSARQLARKLDARIVIVHVRRSRVTARGALPVRLDESARVDRMHELVADLRADGIETALELPVSTLAAPAGIIAAAARRHHAAAIVLATRGRSPLLDTITGGVSRRLLRLAPCPVVVVTPHTTRETFRPVARDPVTA